MAGQADGIQSGNFGVIGSDAYGSDAHERPGMARRTTGSEADAPSWAPLLALGVVAILLPTGSEPSPDYWNLALLAGGAYALYRLAQGAWPLVRLDGLTTLLCAGAALAAVQLATGNTDSPFLTLHGLQFWCGSLLLLPLLREGFALRLTAPQGEGGHGSHDAKSSCASNGNHARNMGAFLVLTIFVVALASGLYGTYYGTRSDGRALWWPFLYRNHLAALLVVTLPGLLWLFQRGTGGRALALGAAVAGTLAVVASGSRGGLALVTLEWIGYGLVVWRARLSSGQPGRRWLFVPAVALLAGLSLLALLGGTAVLEYRMAKWTPLLEGRLDFWKASLAMIAERPVAGWGFGMWPDVYRQFQVFDTGLVVNRAHSDWLEWTAEGGILMSLALAAALWASILRARRHAWAWGLPALLLYGMVDYTLRQPVVWVAFLTLWLASGAVPGGDGVNRQAGRAHAR